RGREGVARGRGSGRDGGYDPHRQRRLGQRERVPGRAGGADQRRGPDAAFGPAALLRRAALMAAITPSFTDTPVSVLAATVLTRGSTARGTWSARPKSRGRCCR